jgi:hypothetical protein
LPACLPTAQAGRAMLLCSLLNLLLSAAAAGNRSERRRTAAALLYCTASHSCVPAAPPSVQVAAFQGHTDSVMRAAWSPDGQLVASGSSDGIVHLWQPVEAALAARHNLGHAGTRQLASLEVRACYGGGGSGGGCGDGGHGGVCAGPCCAQPPPSWSCARVCSYTPLPAALVFVCRATRRRSMPAPSSHRAPTAAMVAALAASGW